MKQIHSITDIQAYLRDHTQMVLFWMCLYTSQRNRKNICELFLTGLFDTAETNLETNYCTSLTNYAMGHFCQLLIAIARATTFTCVALNQEFCQIQLYDEMLRDVKMFSVSVGPLEALSCNNFVLLYRVHV